MTDREKFEQDGFIVIKNFFSTEEIKTLRKKIENYFQNEKNHFVFHNCGKVVPNAFEYVPHLYKIVNKRLVTIINSIVGEIVYLHHSDLHYNMFNKWHKDLSEEYIPGIFEDKSQYDKAAIYKIGIYLQDHSVDNCGLTVKKGSHKNINNQGEEVYIKSNLGDIVIFDQRIYHKGYTLDSKKDILKCKEIENNYKEDEYNIGKEKFKYFQNKRQLENNEKYSVFIGFGKDNELSKVFAKKIIERQNKQNKANYTECNLTVDNYIKDIGIPSIEI